MKVFHLLGWLTHAPQDRKNLNNYSAGLRHASFFFILLWAIPWLFVKQDIGLEHTGEVVTELDENGNLDSACSTERARTNVSGKK